MTAEHFRIIQSYNGSSNILKNILLSRATYPPPSSNSSNFIVLMITQDIDLVVVAVCKQLVYSNHTNLADQYCDEDRARANTEVDPEARDGILELQIESQFLLEAICREIARRNRTQTQEFMQACPEESEDNIRLSRNDEYPNHNGSLSDEDHFYAFRGRDLSENSTTNSGSTSTRTTAERDGYVHLRKGG